MFYFYPPNISTKEKSSVEKEEPIKQIYQKYYQNGVLEVECRLQKNKYEGEYTEYWNHAKKKRKSFYTNGKLHGVSKS